MTSIAACADTETLDDFLGGQVQLLQPKQGYRAGVDPVLLAASVQAKAGQSVLELGCGAGAASLCLAARVRDLSFVGVELQSTYAALARRNAALNGAEMQVVEADLRDLPKELKARSFDHVIANPPYYLRDRSSSSGDIGRDIALGGDTPLAAWIDAGARRLAPKGYMTVIQKAERLPDLLGAMSGRIGSIRVRPVQPRVGRNAQLVIVQGRKSGRADFVLEPALLMHEGVRHEVDGESYTTEVSDILRNSAPLGWG